MSSQFYIVLLRHFDELSRWFAAVRQTYLGSLWWPSIVTKLGDEIVQLDRTEISNTELGVWEFGSK